MDCQELDAASFNFTEQELKNQNLIFTSFDNMKIKIKMNGNNIGNGEKEFRTNKNGFKKEGEITKYESFPSFSNSFNYDGFSNSNLDVPEDSRNNRGTFFGLEDINTTLSFSNLKNRYEKFMRIKNNPDKENENENEIENENEREYGSSNSSPNLDEISDNNNCGFEFSKINESENERIKHNLRILGLNKKRCDAISRFSYHCRIQKPYNENTILCLPKILEKYKRPIVIFMLFAFSFIIILTIVMTIFDAIIPDDDSGADTWNK